MRYLGKEGRGEVNGEDREVIREVREEKREGGKKGNVDEKDIGMRRECGGN